MPAQPVVAQQRPQQLHRLAERLSQVERRARQHAQPLAADRDEDRVHQPVEAADLVDRRVAPVLGRRASRCVRHPAGRVGQQVHVGADHGERRAQLVGDHREQLGACLVEGLELAQLSLLLPLQPAFLDDPGQQRGDRRQEVDLLRREAPRRDRLDVEDADHDVVPGERHGEHRGEPREVEAAEVLEARVQPDVGDLDRPA